MAGIGGLFLSAFYFVVDIKGFHKPFAPLAWMGMNAIFVFVMAAGGVCENVIGFVYIDHPGNNLVHLWQDTILIKNLGYSPGQLLFTIVEIIFWFCISGILNAYSWYWIL